MGDADRQRQTQQSEDALPLQLASAIAKRLAWHEVRSDENTPRDTIVAAYIESLKQLEQFRQDVQRVVEMSCRANLEFRQETGQTHVEARDTDLNKKLAEMLSQASSNWLQVKKIAAASLLSQPASFYRKQLDASISAAVDDFARQFFELLARLVDRELCSLVEWMPNHCCRYHLFRRVVIQEGETNTERVDVTQFDDPEPADGRGIMEIVGRRRTTMTKKVKHQIRYARHEHEVINAIRTSIKNSNVVMPPNIVRLIESIPEWLYLFVEVIDGTIVRERIIERDVKVEDWTQVQIRDEPIMGYEPGVIIGQYVLSGWGPREVSQEQERRKTLEQASTRGRRIAILDQGNKENAGVPYWGVGVFAFQVQLFDATKPSTSSFLGICDSTRRTCPCCRPFRNCLRTPCKLLRKLCNSGRGDRCCGS